MLFNRGRLCHNFEREVSVENEWLTAVTRLPLNLIIAGETPTWARIFRYCAIPFS